MLTPSARVAPCLSEPVRGYAPAQPETILAGDGVTGEKDAVAHAGAVDLFAVPASCGGRVALAIVRASDASIEPEPTLDAQLAPARVCFERSPVVQVAGDGETPSGRRRRRRARIGRGGRRRRDPP
jgi:hypothetical protein